MRFLSSQGTKNAGAAIEADSAATQTITVDGHVVASYDPSSLADGQHTVVLNDVDAAGNVYVADRLNSRIRKILPDGTVSTVAGGAGAGFVNGPLSTAKFMYPRGVAVASTGQLVVADTENHVIRVIDLTAGTDRKSTRLNSSHRT